MLAGGVIPPFCNTSFSGNPWNVVGPISRNELEMGIVTAIEAVNVGGSWWYYAGSNTAGLWKSTDGGANWQNITDLLRVPCLSVTQIALSPNFTTDHTLLMGTGSSPRGEDYLYGLWRSTDGGATWTDAFAGSYPTGEKVDVIRYNPFNSNEIFAGGGTHLWKSTDGGASWNPLPLSSFLPPVCTTPDFYPNIIDMEFSNASTLFISTNHDQGCSYTGGKVLRSTDGGSTWADISTNIAVTLGNIIRVETTPASLGSGSLRNVFVATADAPIGSTRLLRFYKSTNNGSTWSELLAGVYDNSNTEIRGWGSFQNQFELSEIADGIAYLGCTSPFRIDLYNATVPYTNLFGFYIGVGTPYSVHKHADARAITFIQQGGYENLLVGTDGGVTYYDAQYDTWNNKNGNGLTITQYYDYDMFEHLINTGMGGTQDNGTIYNNGFIFGNKKGGDGGTTVIEEYSPDHLASSLAYTYRRVFSLATTNLLYSSTYGSINTPSDLYLMTHNSPIVIDPNDHDRIFINELRPGSTSNITQLTPYYIGTAMSVSSSSAFVKFTHPYSLNFSTIEIAPSNSNVMYATVADPTWSSTVSDRMYKSTDGGTSWADISSVTTLYPYQWRYVTDIEVDPTDESNVFISWSGFSDPSYPRDRVWMTTNGGISWSDISINNGITFMPVLCLAYQNGTDDILYAGTDAGVYMWDKSAGKWLCMNSALPLVPVTSIDIDYCESKIYAATYGRGIFSVDIPITVTSKDYHLTNSITIGTTGQRYFSNNLVIESGVTLTLNGVICMAKDKKIVIKKGGRLMIDGGCITNICGDVWAGIEIEGDEYTNQLINPLTGLDPNHGILVMKNNAVVQNAYVAVNMGLTDGMGNLLPNTFAGIIKAENSTFRNNRWDVKFNRYNLNNISAFKTVTFEFNNNRRIDPVARVTLWGVNFVGFYGCTFQSLATGLAPYNRGFGIYSVDAKFIMDYNLAVPNTFKDLSNGIYAAHVNRLTPPYINGVVFDKCYDRGVYLAGIDYATVSRCTFKVGDSYKAYGLYLHECSYYAVQENRFERTGAQDYRVGVYINNSGPSENLLYNNDFDNLYVGVSCLNTNANPISISPLDPPGKYGLKMNCLDFSNNSYDIYVDGLSPSFSEVRNVQGFSTGNPRTLVQNRYSLNCFSGTTSEPRFRKEPVSVLTVYHHVNPSPMNTHAKEYPGCADPLVLEVFGFFNYQNTHCPCLICSGTLSAIRTNLANADNQWQTYRVQYETRVDGGNTPALLALLGSPIGKPLSYTLMLSVSPYVSDTALIRYFTRTPAPTPVQIRNIALLNSPLSPQVMAVVNALALPPGVLSPIQTAQTPELSVRRTLEANIGYYAAEHSMYVNQLIQYYLYDSLNTSAMDSVISILQREDRVQCQCQQLADAALINGDTLTAEMIINGLLSGADSAYHAHFCHTRQYLTGYCRNPHGLLTVASLPVIQTQLGVIAADTMRHAYTGAQGILSFVMDTLFQELRLVPLPGSGSSKTGDPPPFPDPFGQELPQWQVYPNPVSGVLHVRYTGTEARHLRLVSLLGQEVLSATIAPESELDLSVAGIPDGIYVLTAAGEQGETLYTIRICVQR